MTFQLFTLPGVIDVADFNNDDKLGRGKDMVDRLSTLVSIFNNPALFPRGNCRVQIYELVEDAQILADPKGVTTEFEISPDVQVLADESFLRRLLLNLLDNAIKYNVDGESLSISLTKSGALAVFRIANTGPGISREHENRVFERFYRGDPSRSSDIGGSGLGLSICREIVMAHGGQMWLEQPRSGWTAFTVALSGPESEDQGEKENCHLAKRKKRGVWHFSN